MEAKADTLNRLPSSSSNVVEEVTCPSCNKNLKPYEVAQHCDQEIECLRQMQPNGVLADRVEANGSQQPSEEQRQPWTVFQRVQHNRQSRLKRTRKRQPPSTPAAQQQCPICNQTFPDDVIQAHANRCLRRSSTNGTGNDNSSSDDDTGDSVDEYEWCGQKRIRTSSLLRGGYAAIGIGQPTSSNGRQQEDEDEDLNVVEDDTRIYGPPQYGENDVIPVNETDSDGEGVTSYMRSLITETSTQATTLPVVNSAMITNADSPTTSNATATDNSEPPNSMRIPDLIAIKEDESCPRMPRTKKYYEQVILSLKLKLRQHEHQSQSKFKCLLCLDEYKNPAISVSCWHVHCEECWLRALGARKLCPQCKLITSPKDLRRIYM